MFRTLVLVRLVGLQGKIICLQERKKAQGHTPAGPFADFADFGRLCMMAAAMLMSEMTLCKTSGSLRCSAVIASWQMHPAGSWLTM